MTVGQSIFAITLLAGLAPIANDLYDAAKVDGAGRIQRFLHVTLPSVWPVLLVSTTMSTIWTLNEFTTIWLLTQGGPANATTTLPIATYWYGLMYGAKNLSQAVIFSIALFPVMGVLIWVLSRGMAASEEQA